MILCFKPIKINYYFSIYQYRNQQNNNSDQQSQPQSQPQPQQYSYEKTMYANENNDAKNWRPRKTYENRQDGFYGDSFRARRTQQDNYLGQFNSFKIIITS